MNVSLTPQLERLVTSKVKGGLYGSASEVVRAALRLLEQWDATQAARLHALRRDVRVGITQADQGDVIDGDDVFAALLAHGKAVGGAESAGRHGRRSTRAAR